LLRWLRREGAFPDVRRLMAVIASNRVDLTPLVTHRVKLDDIEKAYDLFSHQRDGVLKVAITP
jgi:alcohol dehydrogenase